MVVGRFGSNLDFGRDGSSFGDLRTTVKEKMSQESDSMDDNNDIRGRAKQDGRRGQATLREC